MSLDHVLHEVTLIYRELSRCLFDISKDQLAPTMLLTLAEVSLVLSTIRPAFTAKTILFIAMPVSFIDGASNCMEIAALTMCLVIQPASTVYVPGVPMNHAAEACRTVSVPMANKNGAIGPNLRALTVPHRWICRI